MHNHPLQPINYEQSSAYKGEMLNNKEKELLDAHSKVLSPQDE